MDPFNKTICECCEKRPNKHWMDWGEWLCSECMESALSEDDDEDQFDPAEECGSRAARSSP